MICANCGHELEEPIPGECPACGFSVGGAAEEPKDLAPAWEKRTSWLDMGAVVETVKACLFEPTATFSRMRARGDLLSPLVFGAALGTLGVLLNFIWRFALGATLIEKLPNEMLGPLGLPMVAGITLWLLSPILVVLALFVASGLYHSMLILLDSDHRGFEATFRVIAYVAGATAILHIVPVLGSLAAIAWALVLSIIGLRVIQKTTTRRAATAVLLPLIVCAGWALMTAVVLGIKMIGFHGMMK